MAGVTLAQETTEPAAADDAKVIQLAKIRVTASPLKSTEAAFQSRLRGLSVISEGLSAESIGRVGASDAGDAVKRVTGTTIVGGKYVYIRGLGERYSNTLLNGVEVPSPEPNRRVVPMDIFPSGLLQSVQTLKTFSPDQPANFSGGSVQIITKDFPEERLLSFSTSVGVNTETSFQDTLRYPGGSLDVLGFDDGTRALPELIAVQAADMPVRQRGIFAGSGFTPDEIQAFGRAFENVWSPETVTAPVDQSYKLSLGDTTQLGGKELGYMAVVSYGNGYRHRHEERNTYRLGARDELTSYTTYSAEKTANEVSWGGVLSGTLKLSPEHRLALRTIYSHAAEDEARTWEGFNADRIADMQSQRILYVERALLSSQLSGEHDLAELLDSNLTWRFVFSRATRNEPDTREVIYEERDGQYSFRDITQSGSRFFFDLTDNEFSGLVDWTTPFQFSQDAESKFKLGGLWKQRERDFDARRFRFEPFDNIEQFVDLTGTPEELFTEGNIDPQRFFLRESTRANDNYSASHQVFAGYAMVDAELSKQWRAVAGARFEASDQDLTAFDPFAVKSTPIVAQITTSDLLPSLSIVYSPTDKMSFRIAASRTVTRPDLREMAPFEFTDFIGGRTIFGNPDLKRTLIDNYDLRWEFYSRVGESLTVSAFYKNFHQPIEQIVQPAAEVRITFHNAEAAHNYGLELDWRQKLDILHGWFRHFSVNANAAVIRSEVTIPEGVGIQTSSERALQGQSPYVVNASLGYDNPENNVTAAISYHLFGRRIMEVGNRGIPDVYEESRPQLDVTFARKFGSHLRVNLTLKNLLDPDVVLKQGDETYLQYNTGQSFSTGLTYNF